jgi:hypothetical protein
MVVIVRLGRADATAGLSTAGSRLADVSSRRSRTIPSTTAEV